MREITSYWFDVLREITSYWFDVLREITSYWFDVLREITSHWFDVKKRANFKQLFCATCRFPYSYLTYVQFATGIMNYFLFHGIKL
jgi:hypothetical protein